MPATPIKFSKPGGRPIWSRRGWDPEGRPRGIRGFVVAEATAPEKSPEVWLWASLLTARKIVAAVASNDAVKLAAGKLRGPENVTRHKIRQPNEDDLYRFRELALAGELDLLEHLGQVVGFLNRPAEISRDVISRLTELKVLI